MSLKLLSSATLLQQGAEAVSARTSICKSNDANTTMGRESIRASYKVDNHR